MIYLDHNATTPIDSSVREAMLPYLSSEWGNPSSTYKFGAKLKGVVEEAREKVAGLLGALTSEIVFTASGTESNNTAIHAALSTGKRHIITSQVEHSSILGQCASLERLGHKVTYLPVDRQGLIDEGALAHSLTGDTAIVSLMWANNETGVLFPIAKLAEICHNRNVLFHCDAIQAAGKLPINLRTLPVDYLSITGHKLNAPKGVGALFIRKKAPYTPLLYGGHQERGRRGGTQNVPFIVALGRAAELASKMLPLYERKVRGLRDRLENGILSAIPGAELNGDKDNRLSNTCNITFRGINSEALLILLDREGVCASSGSACLADSEEPSHVVKAMKPDTGASREMIRFSLSASNEPAEIEATIAAVGKCVRTLSGN